MHLPKVPMRAQRYLTKSWVAKLAFKKENTDIPMMEHQEII